MQTQQIYAHISNMNNKSGRESDGNVYAMYDNCDMCYFLEKQKKCCTNLFYSLSEGRQDVHFTLWIKTIFFSLIILLIIYINAL